MANFRKVVLTLELYVPVECVDSDDDFDVADYINHKLETDVEFFGEVDIGCITVTDEYLQMNI